MATYTSPNVAQRKGVSGPLKAGAVIHATATVTCTAAPATTDTLQFFYLPAGATVLYAILEASDMDTNGTPTLTLNIGDSGSAARYFSASTVGQAGTTAVSTAASGINYLNTAKTLVTGTAANNAATGAAGTVTLTILYRMD